MAEDLQNFLHVVSIHAPVKGATVPDLAGIDTGDRFNPRSREGSDLRRPADFKYLRRFQSTLP